MVTEVVMIADFGTRHTSWGDRRQDPPPSGPATGVSMAEVTAALTATSSHGHAFAPPSTCA